MRALLPTTTCSILVLLVLLAGAPPAASAVSGTRTSFFGWFTDYPTEHNLSAFERSGVALTQIPAWPFNLGEADRYLRDAQQHHIQVLLSIPDRYVTRLGIITAIIKRYRNNPTVWGWYLYDEPDDHHVSPAVLRRAYLLVKDLDSRPVMVTFMSGHCHFAHHRGDLDPAYLQTFDILSIDHFVLRSDNHQPDPLSGEQSYYDRCQQVAQQYHKVGTIIILQGFGHFRIGKVVWRDPTIAEETRMTDMAIRSGAMGIMYWADYRADRTVFNNVNSIISTDSAAAQGSQPPTASALPAQTVLATTTGTPGQTPSAAPAATSARTVVVTATATVTPKAGLTPTAAVSPTTPPAAHPESTPTAVP